MKRLLVLAAAIAACLILPTAASAGVEGERAAFWSLDEPNGTSGANDSADSHDGTYSSSGVTYGVAGARGSTDDAAISLDGTNGKVTTSYNPFQNGTARTFEGWAKRSSQTGYDMLFAGSGTRPPELYLQSGSDEIVFWSDTGTGTHVNWTNVGAGTGSWFHWALVFDEPNHTAELFVNGVSKGRQTLSTSYNASSGNIELGWQDSTNALAGSLDDVAVYNRALTRAEVGQLYTPDLRSARTAFWRLNEPSATGGANDSADSHDGTYSSSGVTYGVDGGTSDGDAAISLNGSGKVTTGYNPFQNGTVRSFEGWAKRDSQSTYDMLVAGDGTRPAELYLRSGADEIVFWPDTGLTEHVTWSAGVGTGTWFHWALVFDEPNNTAELFVNGVSKGTQTVTNPYNSAAGNIQLGYQDSVNAMNGSLDDVSVYNRALTPTEVGQLYVPGIEAARTAFWKLNEANATNGAKDSVDSHDGTYSSSGVTYGVSPASADSDAAISLDGTGKVTTSYNPFQNGTARTFEGWAKRSSQSTYDMLVAGDGTRPAELYMRSGADEIVFWPDTGLTEHVTWPAGVGTGTWFHWALVFDEPNNKAELFVNGVSKGQQTVSNPYNSAAGNIQLGYQDSVNAMNGSLDDVAVYKRALAPEEVDELAVPISFRDSFEGSTFPQVFSPFGAWNSSKLFDTGSGERIDQITPSGFSASQGSKVADAELTSTGERAEIQCHRDSTPNSCAGGEGTEFTYSFDFRVPSGYSAPPRPAILMQTKPTDVTPTPPGQFASGCYGGGLEWDDVSGDSSRVELLFVSRSGIVINDGTGHCTTDDSTTDSLGNVKKDRWHTLKLHARWSTDADVGFIQVWVDGREVIPLRHQRTLIDGSGRAQMFRLGLYESLNADQYHLNYRSFYDNVVIRRH